MSTNIVEIATFKLASGVTEADFLEQNAQFMAFVNAQPGSLYRSVSKHADTGVYTDIVYWTTLEDAKRVQAAFEHEQVCQQFAALIDKDSLSLTLTEVVAQSPCSG
ncbi:hypothetical protein [Pseudoalteromonas sp. OOF1S-7]|uniref:antibiotic biosynthesis monooxygenase family protein n=1 Tax=Pseudoalteromonas sp. OOF1S-7 TaxID=2917757 RepID=UPI001EF4B7C3|nr:hypothetical protein [Pseudoalteromonas sp. OOF1S-7]MCG7534291.1 hypothetical protein [Pseudoalteromonas sp. OOF1S-7]